MSFDFKTWYAKNKEDFNAKRRARYANDPEYRAKQRARTEEWKARQRELRRAERGDAPRTRDRTIMVECAGGKVAMHTIGVFSERVGKSIVTLRSWERKGFLPESPFRSSRGDRLYTDAMIDVVAGIVAGRSIVQMDDEMAKAKIRQVWEDQGQKFSELA